MRPSSLPIGWSPPARSMIDSRRAASADRALDERCRALSGPRWTSVSFIAASDVGVDARAPSSDDEPADAAHV